jgi:hypothetical protein
MIVIGKYGLHGSTTHFWHAPDLRAALKWVVEWQESEQERHDAARQKSFDEGEACPPLFNSSNSYPPRWRFSEWPGPGLLLRAVRSIHAGESPVSLEEVKAKLAELGAPR